MGAKKLETNNHTVKGVAMGCRGLGSPLKSKCYLILLRINNKFQIFRLDFSWDKLNLKCIILKTNFQKYQAMGLSAQSAL